jgi:hypothetical protein
LIPILIGATALPAQDRFDADRSMIFLSTFDSVTDVNLFGADEKGGWIYTAESTERKNVLVQNRCKHVTIAENQGKLGDSLQFSKTSDQVLFYYASANLPRPRNNWAATVSFWLKPDLGEIGPKACYPLQFSDGDWTHGGFFVRFPCMDKTVFEFGAVSALDAAEEPVADVDDMPHGQVTLLNIEDAPLDRDRWTMVTLTLRGVNPNADEDSVASLYLNGKLAGEVKQPLRFVWMAPGEAEPDAAMFLGINYIGGMDDLRIYDKELSEKEVRMLPGAAK